MDERSGHDDALETASLRVVVSGLIQRADAAAYRLFGRDDLTGALLFLSSDASAYITGQTLLIDGGVSVNDTRALPRPQPRCSSFPHPCLLPRLHSPSRQVVPDGSLRKP